MKLLHLSLLAAVLLLSAGCQNFFKTMVAHTTIDKRATTTIAKANAYVNVCLASRMLDRQRAIEFSLAAAQFLDFVVFDNDHYARSYESHLEEANDLREADAIASSCADLDQTLPKMTAHIQQVHYSSAERVAAMRAEENRQIAYSLRNLAPAATVAVPAPTFPRLNFVDEQPQTQSYLVNTNSGLRQCKVTSSGFVFCL